MIKSRSIEITITGLRLDFQYIPCKTLTILIIKVTPPFSIKESRYDCVPPRTACLIICSNELNLGYGLAGDAILRSAVLAAISGVVSIEVDGLLCICARRLGDAMMNCSSERTSESHLIGFHLTRHLNSCLRKQKEI